MSAAKKLTHEYLVDRLDELPTLPSIVYELTQVINDPMSSTSDIEKIMANDQSMTTKVLKLVNSAYYAIPGGVTSLSRAVAYIGFDSIQQLVLGASIVKALDAKGPSEFDVNQFWKHSIAVGMAAETIAKITRHPMPSDMFTCGLVHDMGKVALFSISPVTVVELSNYANEKKMSYFEAEQNLGILNHTNIGKLLAEKWALPISIQAVIKNHHQKDHNLRGGLSADLNNSVDIVFLANLLIHALKFGNSGHSKVLGAPKEVMTRLTIDPQKDFKELIANIKTSLDKANDFIRVICG
ncbi:MAG: HDOD domain-containing protein [Bdellovibrionaceae bacterium]|nr:HDOD domain-containing protein [Pseudobdellovibrionaceae bacterium]